MIYRNLVGDNNPYDYPIILVIILIFQEWLDVYNQYGHGILMDLLNILLLNNGISKL
jgi:hypothetical protein